MNDFTALLTLMAIGNFYMAPTLICIFRRKQVAGILAVNLLFGWTFIGWGVALVWAVVTRREQFWGLPPEAIAAWKAGYEAKNGHPYVG